MDLLDFRRQPPATPLPTFVRRNQNVRHISLITFKGLRVSADKS
jgi:hypothetical protein